MNIGQLMNKQVIKVRSTTLIPEVAKTMKKENIGAMPVEDDGRLVGVITDRDITIEAVADGGINRPIKDIMTGKPVTILENASPDEALDLMVKNSVRRLVVMRDGGVVGLLTLDDLAGADRDVELAKALRSFHNGKKKH
jgi:CBS domain-containing protein